MSETAAAPQLTGQMFLFQRPELINKEQHGDLAVGTVDKRFGFCANIRAVPLTVSEIPAAMKDYPVVFASQDQLIPIAILGLIDDVNLMVDENGQWENDRYIPGYIRRYPFGVANETGGERIAIVVDAAFDGFVREGGQPLFESGEPTQIVQQAIEFCKSYEEDRARTADFANRIKDLGVVKGQSAQYTPQGETQPRTFAEYIGVDENALKELDGQKFLELRENGILPILYAMVMSMGNWRTLMTRRARRFNLREADVLNPALN